MGETSATTVVAASLAEVWDFYFEPATWASWVDGFGRVERSEGYPDVGGTLEWGSIPAGRGEVSERVLEHEPRSVHRIAYTDPQSEGEQTTHFEIEPGAQDSAATRVTLEIAYRLRDQGVLGGIVDRLFVRSQVRGSLERSLERLRIEVESRA
jgi:uncharacterized protein YndB with AHSA1/START domain